MTLYSENTEKFQIKHLDLIWLKASVVGGLWASVEIIIGSFLHNIRIPFAGSILAAQGIILLIAFYQLWPHKGLIWRAGLICALMKSISPSAIILGPMIGIFSEAILLELAILIFGQNVFGYLLGGALSLLSALIHKVVGVLILYGFDIVKIYTNIYYYISKQVKIENSDPWVLVWIIILAYILLGALAAMTGYLIGKRSKNMKSYPKNFKMESDTKKDFFELKENQKFSVLLFFINLLIIPIGLLLLNNFNFYLSLIIITAYLLFCIIYYSGSLKRLKKPIFWIQLIIITILAAIFWSGYKSTDGIVDLKGLMVGIKMNIRAIFIVIAFSSLSVELRSPIIKAFLFKNGFKKIYLSLGLAFNALPVMMLAIPGPKDFIKKPFKSVANLILYSEEWLEVFEKNNRKNN
ncbi:MAG: hypothetical protein K8R58_06240 [Bacteroidales bacterium]|nr:hypothetical protein [Bacteroidales bacterium]